MLRRHVVALAIWIAPLLGAALASTASPGASAKAVREPSPAAATPAAPKSTTSTTHKRTTRPARGSLRGVRWPEGTVVLPVENLDGIVIATGVIHGENAAETTRVVVDTGAGFLALDRGLAFRIGADADSGASSIGYTDHPVRRLEIGSLQIDQVWPTLTADLDVVRRVTDRPVRALLGQRLFVGRALVLDYCGETMAIVPMPQRARERTESSPPRTNQAIARTVMPPELAGALSAAAIGIPFDLVGDGKMVVRARLGAGSVPLTLIVDTGASKSVFFTEALARRAPQSAAWPSLEGLAAPTLLGSEAARMVRVPELTVDGAVRRATARGMDAAVIRSPLAAVLSRAVGEPVDGLLGYSFLKAYRVAVDYVNHVLWLDPQPAGWDGRDYEYSHVGIQIERRGEAIEVAAVATGSPAARAGIASGDRVVSIAGVAADRGDVSSLSRRFEGPPGTSVRVVIRRGDEDRSYLLVRRKLL